ncbi:hypothetical protein J6590_017691 [Homalodisca vitripennis]|nr:hypothetical protein J6590_017691 [Homalodisca vitripennis]
MCKIAGTRTEAISTPPPPIVRKRAERVKRSTWSVRARWNCHRKLEPPTWATIRWVILHSRHSLTSRQNVSFLMKNYAGFLFAGFTEYFNRWKGRRVPLEHHQKTLYPTTPYCFQHGPKPSEEVGLWKIPEFGNSWVCELSAPKISHSLTRPGLQQSSASGRYRLPIASNLWQLSASRTYRFLTLFMRWLLADLRIWQFLSSDRFQPWRPYGTGNVVNN